MYKETGQEKFLNKVKKYCKNDVRITLWVILYLVKHQEVFLDGQAYILNTDDLIEMGKPRNQESTQIQRLVG
jgi:hypothetical protein